MRSVSRGYVEQLIDALGSSIRLLIVSVSIEETTVALASRLGVRVIATINNNYIQDKESGGSLLSQRYIDDVLKAIRQLAELHKPDAIVLAAQSMLINSIPNPEVGRIPVERVTVSEGGLVGVYEVERRGYLDKLGLRLGYEAVSRIMEELGRGGGLVALGDEVHKALSMGAAESVVMLSRFLMERAEEVRGIVEMCMRTRARLIIVPEDSEAGRVLNGLGGLAALLRYRIS
jgi:protein pelota